MIESARELMDLGICRLTSVAMIVLFLIVLPGEPNTTIPPSVASVITLSSTSELAHDNDTPSAH